MDRIFNRHKRKHNSQDDGSERDRKHKKHNGDNSPVPSISNAPVPFPPDIKSSFEIPGRRPKTAKAQKLGNLLRALNETLEEDELDETLSLAGDETLNRCLDLRTSLRKHQFIVDAAAMKPPLTPQRMSISHDFFQPNNPKSMSAFSLTPWRSSTIPLTIPPLPKVLDPTLEASAFIHVGCGSGKPTDLSYERLEWVGDAYLYLTSTLLISQTFPSLLPGKCSQLRERLVKNVTLAEYSRQYGFDKRAQLPDKLEYGLQSPGHHHEHTKVMGDIFEAYVAAVVLSDPADGVRKVSEWLKDLWGMTIAKDILHEERSGLKLDSPLWRLRGNAEPIQSITSTTQLLPLNPKDQLVRLIGAKGVKLSYKDAAPEKKDPKNKLPLFTVGVYLDGWGEKDKMLGSGRANGKKDAGMKAAEMALANKKLMKVYMERKKIFEEHMELERETLDQNEGASF